MNTLRDYILSPWVLMVLTTITFGTEFFVSSPAYIVMLDMGVIPGNALALGMATLFVALPKISAQLFVREKIGLGVLGILCGVGLMFIAYMGQKAVAAKKANNVMDIILAGGASIEPSSSTEIGHVHLTATGLLALLFTCSLFLSYVFYRDEAKFKPTKRRLIFSRLLRIFEQKHIPLLGRFERAEDNPLLVAQGRVNARIADLEEEELRLQRKLDITKGHKRYELEALGNLRARIGMAIQTAYKY